MECSYMGTETSSLAPPTCCDANLRDRDCGRFGRACDSYFVFCLRTLRTERGDYDCRGNYRDTIVTSVNSNDGPINFTNKTVLGVENPFIRPGLTDLDGL